MRWILKKRSISMQQAWDPKPPSAEKTPFFWIFEKDTDGAMFVNGFSASLQHARNMYAYAIRQGYSRIDLSKLSERDASAISRDADEFLANLQEEYALTQMEEEDERRQESRVSQMIDPVHNFTPESDYFEDTYNAGDVEEMF